MHRVVAIAVLLCAARVASAAPVQRTVGVVTVGEKELRTAVGGHMEDWLREHGHEVVIPPLSPDAANTLANCLTLDDLVCAKGVFKARAKTDMLVYVRIEKTGADVAFNVYWFETGKDPVLQKQVCTACSSTSWQGITDPLLQRLAGEGVGESHSRWPALSLMGGGVATLAAGGVFLYYGSLDGPDRKYIYPDSTAVGIALCAVGAGAAIGGTLLLIQSGSSSSGPVATASHGQISVGWAGRF
jgi:hypothetical protein